MESLGPLQMIFSALVIMIAFAVRGGTGFVLLASRVSLLAK